MAPPPSTWRRPAWRLEGTPAPQAEEVRSALRAAAWAFSLLAFLIMVCNEHGDWKQFDRYEEYRCVRAPSRRPLPILHPIDTCGGCVPCERN
jgi:hypothetical protein